MDKILELFLSVDGDIPKTRLIIVGVNPLIHDIINSAEMFCDMLRTNCNLKITFVYESNSENFNQSLFYAKGISRRKMDFNILSTYRTRLIGGEKGKKQTAGLLEDIIMHCEDDKEIQDFSKRITLLQNNLRQFVNIIVSDDLIRYCFTTLDIPTYDMYRTITNITDKQLYTQLEQYVDFLFDRNTGGKFLSKPDDELIELYDMNDIPRGIYPRKAFYSTEFYRYSIWAFIFNRRGELLLQQRSQYTADNRGLWDKSAGGHVDLVDSSTIETAKRELIEELFLPEAEYSKHIKADLGDIVDFGEWNIEKRPEKNFLQEFDGLAKADWIVFRAVDQDGDPMTIKRKSARKIHVKDTDNNGNYIAIKDEKGQEIIDENGRNAYQEHIETWFTRFISDVFLFIAPDGYIDSQESINELMGIAEKRGAQSAHKLLAIENLIEEVEKSPQYYTDDIIYMCEEKKRILIGFAESIKYIFKKYSI